MLTRREYWMAAAAVPQLLANLLVPRMATGAVSGSSTNSAGTWISPPPPTTESMKPARNEKPHSARSVGSGSLTSGQQAEFVLPFLRNSAGNEFVRGAQPLAINSEEGAVGRGVVRK